MTECRDCQRPIGRLEMFPEGRCVDCHARSQEGRDLTEMWNEMCHAFGAKGAMR